MQAAPHGRARDPVCWLIWAMVCGLRESAKARITARPRANEVMKSGSVRASISSAMLGWPRSAAGESGVDVIGVIVIEGKWQV